MTLPTRRMDVDFAPFSTVLTEPMMCYPNSPLDFEQVTLPHRGASSSRREVSFSSITIFKSKLLLKLFRLLSRSFQACTFCSLTSANPMMSSILAKVHLTVIPLHADTVI